MRLDKHFRTIVCLLLSLYLPLGIYADDGDDDADGTGVDTVTVNCDEGKSIQKEIDKSKPGDVIEVIGTCNEHLLVPEEIHRITLDGLGAATINGTDPTLSTLTVRGRGITVQGLTITGPLTGIFVNGNGAAVILNNFVRDARFGIFLQRGSTAFIRDTTLDNISVIGVGATRGASFSGRNLSINGEPNVGISVERNATGDLSDLTIGIGKSTQTGTGIKVFLGGSVRVNRGTIANQQLGAVAETGGVLDLVRVTLENILQTGVVAGSNASFSGRNLIISGTPEIGIHVAGNASGAVTQLDIQGAAGPPMGRGIQAISGGSLRVDGGTIENQQFGAVAETGGILELLQVTLEANDRGIWVPGGSLSLRGSTVQINLGDAIVADRGNVDISGSQIQNNATGGLILDHGSSGQIGGGSLVQSLGLRVGATARVSQTVFENIDVKTNSTLLLNDESVVTGSPGIRLDGSSVLEASGDVPVNIVISEISCEEMSFTTQVLFFGPITVGPITNCNVSP